MTGTHKARVVKVRDAVQWPWQMTCTCGDWQTSDSWKALLEWTVKHVRLTAGTEQPVVDQVEPIDLQPFVKTRLAWDLLEHSEMSQWLPRLGLLPAADDMDDLEHRESHARASQLVPIARLTEVYAAIIAEIQTAYYIHESGHDVEADNEEFTDMVFRLLRSGMFAVLAEFLSDGVLAYGPQVVMEHAQ
jgi:hypothetical protein